MGIPRIVVGFHSYGTCPTQFVVDVAKALRYSGTIIPHVLHEQSCYVDGARNKLAESFLSQPEATHLMMIDVDISFESDAILKTFTIMQAYHADLIYGNYSLGSGANSIFGPPDNAAQESAVRVKLEANKVYTDIATGGTGWLMVTRELLLRMKDAYAAKDPWPWFGRDITNDGKGRRGEDITFGLRAYNLDPRPKIVGTTAVLLRHLKMQGFFPDHMSQVAVGQGVSGIVVPNPYESDPSKYAIMGNSVVDKSSLTPEQKAEVERIQKEMVEDAQAVRSDAGQICGGSEGGLPEVQRGPDQGSQDLQLAEEAEKEAS